MQTGDQMKTSANSEIATLPLNPSDTKRTTETFQMTNNCVKFEMFCFTSDIWNISYNL